MSATDLTEGDDVPPGVTLKLRRMMFAAPVSTGMYMIGLGVATAALALKIGDRQMAWIAGAALSLNLLRVVLVAGMASYDARSQVHLPSLLAIGCIFSLLMATLVMRAFAIGDIEAIAMAVVLAAGYLSGVLIRASVVPSLAIPHIFFLFVPLILAAVFGFDGQWHIAFLLTCFCVGCVDLSRIIHSHIAAQFLAEHELSLAAKTDSLTALANRVALDGALAERFASAKPAIVAMVDLDGFKSVNDNHGHGVGDELLRAVAGRLSSSLAGRHLAARFGGDEFAVLFDADASTDDASCICEEIVRRVGSAFQIGRNTCRIGASVGLADGSCSTDFEMIKERADEALYVAKRRGRGRVVWWTDPAPLAPTNLCESTHATVSRSNATDD